MIPKTRTDWTATAALVLGVIVESAFQITDFLVPLAAQLPGARWIGVVLAICGIIVRVATRFGFRRADPTLLPPAPPPRGYVHLRFVLALSLAVALLFGAVIAQAQDVTSEAAMDATEMSSGTDPGAVLADAVAQAAPDPRWSFKIGSVTVAASASFAPAVLSLSDLKLSIGPNVGAGADVTWTSGYGFAAHGAMRETADGLRPLGAAFAILPFLQKYGVRPGVLYQFGGGAAPYRDGFMLAIAGASNFGFPSGL
jgi:hypothetical protein